MTQNINLTIPVIEKISTWGGSGGGSTPGGDTEPIQTFEWYIVPTQPGNKAGTMLNVKSYPNIRSAWFPRGNAYGILGQVWWSNATIDWKEVNYTRTSINLFTNINPYLYKANNKWEEVIAQRVDLWVEKLNTTATVWHEIIFDPNEFEYKETSWFTYNPTNDTLDFMESENVFDKLIRGQGIDCFTEDGHTYSLGFDGNNINLYEVNFPSVTFVRKVLDGNWVIYWNKVVKRADTKNGDYLTFSCAVYSCTTAETTEIYTHEFERKYVYQEWTICDVVVYNRQEDKIAFFHGNKTNNSSWSNSQACVFVDSNNTCTPAWSTNRWDNDSYYSTWYYVTDENIVTVTRRLNSPELSINFQTNSFGHDGTQHDINNVDYVSTAIASLNTDKGISADLKRIIVDRVGWDNYIASKNMISIDQDITTDWKVIEFFLDDESTFVLTVDGLQNLNHSNFSTIANLIKYWYTESLSNMNNYRWIIELRNYTKTDFAQTQTSIINKIKFYVPIVQAATVSNVTFLKY